MNKQYKKEKFGGKMKFILIILVLTGCQHDGPKPQISTEYKMECSNLGLNVQHRCENKEVVCYMTSNYGEAGISCKFKEE